jgi:hypothetical protein
MRVAGRLRPGQVCVGLLPVKHEEGNGKTRRMAMAIRRVALRGLVMLNEQAEPRVVPWEVPWAAPLQVWPHPAVPS